MTTLARAASAATLILAATASHAQIIVSEVAPWSSGNSAVAADWFELTNTGTTAVTITGWKVDDNSNSFISSLALNGVTSIGAGESVIFIEGAAVNASFLSNWFGASAPAGLQIGFYSGSGIGLGTGGDAVNIFDAAGNTITRVVFGASPAAAPFATFDNAAGLSGAVTLSALSFVGGNGAFLAASGTEIGSPGSIAAVPEPGSIALLLAGLGVVAGVARRRPAA
jgi:hypothetical protein